jgi:ribosomal protein S18 acetylase RimI-like enzyme
MLNLRPATALDQAFLRQLHHLAYHDVVLRQFGAWEEEAQDFWFERSLELATFRVIERDQLAVGALGTKEEPTRLDIVELQVLPAWQNQGIGAFVILGELERARALGKPVHLRVLKENRAQRLYERHGFVVTGESDTHYTMQRTWP